MQLNSISKSVCLFSILCLFCMRVAAIDGNPKDTLYTELKNDIVILSSTKETNSLRYLPAAVSVFSPKNLESLQIQSMKDLSGIVPNYFAADYGSKMTAPLYIRGIGARSGDQNVSVYVDNMPYFNTTSYDIELFDIQRIEVLRGTQGTLYGRNSMGGIINIYTYSPLSHEGTSVKLEGGSYGLFSGTVSHSQKLGNNMGFSIGGYYKQDDGYFENKYTGKKEDDLKNAGGRIKFAWNITPRFTATYSANFDYVDQGAFPYASVKTNEVNYNSEGFYKRRLLTNGVALRYLADSYEINSTTGYQYLNDEMNMDQDYTPRSIFYINQKQRQNSISQEVTIKSTTSSNYQWSFGGYGFYDYLHTTPPVYMMKDGIKSILQAQIPATVPITFTDERIELGGQYKRPIYGAAIFHQSTFNNILETEGLSFTLGLRLDYEKNKLEYDAGAVTNLEVKGRPGTAPIPYQVKTEIVGNSSNDFLELLPKALIKYQINPNSYTYVSASRGYKAGGHNIQIFADLLNEQLATDLKKLSPSSGSSTAEDISINDRISYKPEYSWNYEWGGQIGFFNNALTTNFTLYYIDVRNVQITKFVPSGQGRMVSNAGRAVSKGFELGLKARPCTGFFLYANYGFADARFKGNSSGELDYMNNHIPFAPQSTLSVGGSMSYDFKKKTILDRITLDTNFTGIGNIYWSEANDKSQGFYGVLNAHLALEKNIFKLEFWAKNILDRNYNTFLFDSFGSDFAQKGKPARFGASLKVSL